MSVAGGVVAIVKGAINEVRELWPDGDPDKLNRAADAFFQLSVAVTESGDVGSRARARILAAAQGKAPDSFRQYYGQIDAGLPDLSKAALEIAKQLREYAEAITEARNQIKSLIIEIGAVMAVAGVASVVTLGIGAPAAEAAAIARTAWLVARAARIGIALNATVARLAASAAYGVATGAFLALLEIPIIKIVKIETGVEDDKLDGEDLKDGLWWLAGGAGFAGLTSAARSGWRVRRLNRIGAERGWGRPALAAPRDQAGSHSTPIRTVGPDESIDDVLVELDRLSFQTGFEHALVRGDDGVLTVVRGSAGQVDIPRNAAPIAHTHTWGWPVKKRASEPDYIKLHKDHLRTGVESATVREEGVVHTYSIHDPEYKALFPDNMGGWFPQSSR